MTSDAKQKARSSSPLTTAWNWITQAAWYPFMLTTFEAMYRINIYHYFWYPLYWFLIKLYKWGVAPVKFMNYGYICQVRFCR